MSATLSSAKVIFESIRFQVKEASRMVMQCDGPADGESICPVCAKADNVAEELSHIMLSFLKSKGLNDFQMVRAAQFASLNVIESAAGLEQIAAAALLVNETHFAWLDMLNQVYSKKMISPYTNFSGSIN